MEQTNLFEFLYEDFKNVAKSQSDSSLYHLAGDSIVTNVLIEIFRQLFQKD